MTTENEEFERRMNEEAAKRNNEVVELAGKVRESHLVAAIGFVLNALSHAGRIFQIRAEPTLKRLERAVNAEVQENIPSPQDMVRFELREVFRGRDRVEQLSPPPSETFRDFMRQLGYSDFWSDSFWAAHWELPSVLQGYEMFHRLRKPQDDGTPAFTIDDLKKLLKKQDILPTYQDQLIRIAYSPYTRVDIRRMRRLGILDRAGVYEAHRDLGYDEEKAGKLTEFVEKDTDLSERGITRSEVGQAYVDGLIAEEFVNKWLEKEAYPDEDKKLYMRLLKYRKDTYDKPRTDRELTASQVIEGMKKRLLSDSQARERLMRLGYAADTAELIVRIEKTPMPK